METGTKENASIILPRVKDNLFLIRIEGLIHSDLKIENSNSNGRYKFAKKKKFSYQVGFVGYSTVYI